MLSTIGAFHETTSAYIFIFYTQKRHEALNKSIDENKDSLQDVQVIVFENVFNNEDEEKFDERRSSLKEKCDRLSQKLDDKYDK